MAVQPTMPLLLLMEQTVPRKVMVPTSGTSSTTVDLAWLKTEDGRVDVAPSLTCSSNGIISLSVSNYRMPIWSPPTMLHCKITTAMEEVNDNKEHYLDSDESTDNYSDEAVICLRASVRRLGLSRASSFKESTSMPKAEARIILDGSLPFETNTEVKLQCSSNQWQRLTRVTITYYVYDIVAARPVAGAGLHLNRARLQGAHCDVKLVVEDVELAAHRAVLAARSPVLDKMLSGDFKEAREGRVELVDFPATAVEKFIEFLYTDRIEDWGKCEVDLLGLADKYMVPELRSACTLSLWNCEPLRALEILHDAGLCVTVSGKLRQRLTATVLDDLKSLTDTKEWAVFSATYPVLVDTMLGSLGAARASDDRVSVWSL